MKKKKNTCNTEYLKRNPCNLDSLHTVRSSPWRRRLVVSITRSPSLFPPLASTAVQCLAPGGGYTAFCIFRFNVLLCSIFVNIRIFRSNTWCLSAKGWRGGRFSHQTQFNKRCSFNPGGTRNPPIFWFYKWISWKVEGQHVEHLNCSLFIPLYLTYLLFIVVINWM